MLRSRHRPPLYDVIQLSSLLVGRPGAGQPVALLPGNEPPPDFFAIHRASMTENFFPAPSVPFRINFALISLTLGGSSERFIGLSHYTAQPGMVQLIPPYQIMGTANRSDDYEAISLLFSPEFYRLAPYGNSLHSLPFFTLDATPYLHIPPSHWTSLLELATAMECEYAEQAADWMEVVHAYLRIFLLRLKRLYVERAVQQSRATTTRQALAARFQALVEQRFAQVLHGQPALLGVVSAYAQELGVEESYLGEVVRETTGRAPSEMIRERLSIEARYLVRYSDLTVAEIAELLGFTEVSYFSRWFKQQVGVSPAHYRR